MRLNSKVVQFYITEQTIPFEENIEQPPEYKLEKYENLQEGCIRYGWISNIINVEFLLSNCLSCNTLLYQKEISIKIEELYKETPKSDRYCICMGLTLSLL